MQDRFYKYVIVGAGLAGASAAEGIREVDRQSPILLIGEEPHLPYDRPPLSKKLWFGQKKVEEIFLHDQHFYDTNGITVEKGAKAVELNTVLKQLSDDKGAKYRYDKLLLATGGEPRRLAIPGGNLEDVSYYRYLDDFHAIRAKAGDGKKALIVGGGFIGSEMAAALNKNNLDVTMIFPDEYLVRRIFPEQLGRALQNHYIGKGVKIIAGDIPTTIERRGSTFVTRTKNGEELESDILIVGIGIRPAIELAQSAGLATGNGIVVNEYLQTSGPDIYAAGDAAEFPYEALGIRTRIEHWDNSLTQGKFAGRNMAGAKEAYTHMPYFFSDLFEFGYEAVGEINSELTTYADWQKENDTGVIYYMKDKKVRGVMMCNVWDKVEAARALIRKGGSFESGSLKGAIG